MMMEYWTEPTDSRVSSVRRPLESSIYTSYQNQKKDDNAESESVSEAGDIGDRALRTWRRSESNNHGSSSENVVLSISAEQRLQSHQKPLPPFLKFSSAFGNGMVGSEDVEFHPAPCAPAKDAFTRCLLQKLFGPGGAGVTSDNTILYPDLPSNMVGSFLMGWFGVVFKGDISSVSEHVAIGLATGYLGSLTTFSAWNQKMLDHGVHGRWLFSFLGFFIGFFLIANSIIFGVETAKGFRWLLRELKWNCSSTTNWKVDSYKRRLAVMVAFLVVLGLLWGVSAVLLKQEFKDGGLYAEVGLGCLEAPPGVWIRWFLARLNGRGLGRKGLFKWIPFRTLIVNLSAACIRAARVYEIFSKQQEV